MTVAVLETKEIQLVQLGRSTKALCHVRIKQSSGVKVKSELEQTGAQSPRRQAHRLPERTRKYLFLKINCLIEG